MENNPQDMMAVGPGAFPDEQIDPRPLLEGFSEQQYVDVHNILAVDFVGKVGQTRPVSAPLNITVSSEVPGVTQSEQEVRSNYGLNLRNKDYQSKTHIVNKVVLRTGETKRLPGNVASVVVGQLVTEIMGRRGQKLLLANLSARHLVEEEVVMGHGFISDLMNSAPMTIEEQLNRAIEEKPSEEFPDLDSAGSGEAGKESSNSTGNDSAGSKPAKSLAAK